MASLRQKSRRLWVSPEDGLSLSRGEHRRRDALTVDEILDQVRDLLQQRGRLSYQALKRRFELDDAYLDDLKVE